MFSFLRLSFCIISPTESLLYSSYCLTISASSLFYFSSALSFRLISPPLYFGFVILWVLCHLIVLYACLVSPFSNFGFVSFLSALCSWVRHSLGSLILDSLFLQIFLYSLYIYLCVFPFYSSSFLALLVAFASLLFPSPVFSVPPFLSLHLFFFFIRCLPFLGFTSAIASCAIPGLTASPFWVLHRLFLTSPKAPLHPL